MCLYKYKCVGNAENLFSQNFLFRSLNGLRNKYIVACVFCIFSGTLSNGCMWFKCGIILK